MTKRLEFIFDFGSPNAYLAYRALPPILARTGAELVITPCLLGGLFKLTDNRPPLVAFAGVKGKVEYEKLEIKRFIAKHGLTKFRMNPHFPVNTLMLMRGLVAARLRGEEAAYLEMGLQGLWEEGLKLDDKDVLARRTAEAGLDADAIARGRPAPGGQTEPRRDDGRRRPSWRLRHSDLLRRRGNVLRQGEAGAGRGGVGEDPGLNGAPSSEKQTSRSTPTRARQDMRRLG